jgi:hypothetical protein
MSENITELNMIQLRRALQQAALPADRQIDRLKGFDVPFEVADDVGNQILWALQWPDAKLTDEQRSNLVALDALTTQMSGEQNAELWTDDALRSRPEWEEVRHRARKILKLFQWPLEDADDPGVQVVRPSPDAVVPD